MRSSDLEVIASTIDHLGRLVALVADGDRLPLYGEIQTPLQAGVRDALLDELLDSAAAVATGYTNWLHDEVRLLR